MTYVYRLKMVDLDGSSSMSDEKVVTIDAGDMTLGIAQPNPATSSEVTFELTLDEAANLDVIVYDMNGNEISKLSGTKQAGPQKLSVDLQNYAAGTYTLVVRNGEVLLNRQFTVVK